VAKHSGGLELTWTDKDKTLLSVGDGRYDYTFVDSSDYRVSEIRLLHEVERVSAPDGRPEDSELPEPTTDNLLITGDAMHVLDALAKIPEYSTKYLGKVKLVYIDPPFNTGLTFEHYEDNIQHSVWLTMLRDRLRQIRPLLARSGSVWVHLDDVEVHRCRVVLDEEFGPENFVAEVAWRKRTSVANDSATLPLSTTSSWSMARAKRSRSTASPGHSPRTTSGTDRSTATLGRGAPSGTPPHLRT
jgi:adenine-specific DNA-methyltransferase